MTRCTQMLRNGSDNWQATRGAQLDKNRQSEFALRIRHVCAHCVHTLPPSHCLSLSFLSFYSNGHISSQSPRITHSYPQLCNSLQAKSLRLCLCLRLLLLLSLSLSLRRCPIWMWTGMWTSCELWAASCGGSTQPLKSESSVPQLSQQRQRARTRSAKVNQFLQNIRATN